MAEEALKKLEEQLNCSICLDTYTDPKQLQCNHIYCRQCLVPLVVRDQQGQLGLTCPTCRQVTPIPDRGMAGLQSAFHINNLQEIKHSVQKLQNPAPGATPSRWSCSEHVNEELKLFCETCGQLVCLQCVLKGNKHSMHDCAVLSKAFEKYKEEIMASLEPMEKQVITMEEALAHLDACCGEISDQRATTEDSIHTAFRRLQEVFDVRKTELIGQLHRITQEKLKGLAAQRDRIEMALAQLYSCVHLLKEKLSKDSEESALSSKTETLKLAKRPDMPDLKPSNNADTVFFASADMAIAVCQSYGELLTCGLPNPLKCHILDKGIKIAAVGEKSVVVVQAINSDGAPCEDPIQSMKCSIESELTYTRANCSVERRGQSQYEISYQPTVKGRHQIHIKAEGQHIRGSPFSIAVKSPVEKLGTPIFSRLARRRVGRPWGVAVDERGEVVVTQCGGDIVTVFSPSGEKSLSFGTHGTGQGQFVGPCKVTVDGEGNILVTESGNHRIQKFTAEGQFLAAVGTEGSGPLQFSLPAGIAYNASNDMLYVVDAGNCRVQVLNSDLTFSRSFGKRGRGKRRFTGPCDIACDGTGRVYVTDSDNHRVQVFEAQGKFKRVFGKRGSGEGELDTPIGVAIDSSDIVYVSEAGNNRVSVFTLKGQFVTSFGRRGERPGEFFCPRGLAVDNSGVVYVCDFDNNRVQVF